MGVFIRQVFNIFINLEYKARTTLPHSQFRFPKHDSSENRELIVKPRQEAILQLSGQ